MKTKLDLDWKTLNARADAQGIVIDNGGGRGNTSVYRAYKKSDPKIQIQTEHFGGHYSFDGGAWFDACQQFVRKHEVQERWNRRQHKHAISRAYEALCTLAEALGLDSCLTDDSALGCGIIINPSDPKARLEIIATTDGLVELHAENLPTIGGKPSRRWNYTVVTIHGGGSAHDDPPPNVEESKPMCLDGAVRAFATAALTNKITFANLNL